MRKYCDKIEYLRMQLRYLSCEAQKNGSPVSPEFYEIQKELDRVWENLRSWCKRHGEDFPVWLMYA